MDYSLQLYTLFDTMVNEGRLTVGTPDGLVSQ